MGTGKKEKPKSLMVNTSVHKDLKIFVTAKGRGSMQSWTERFVREGLEREGWHVSAEHAA